MKGEIAIFAGGCFWCMESAFDVAKKTILPGIKGVTSGYAGKTGSPSYQNHKGYREAIKVIYNPRRVKYKELLKIFWQNIDPTDSKGQFADKGESYTTAIYYTNLKQKELAQKSKKEVSKLFDKSIVTKILKAQSFYPAEEYHQEYYKKNPIQYKAYKFMSGRSGFIKENAAKFR